MGPANIRLFANSISSLIFLPAAPLIPIPALATTKSGVEIFEVISVMESKELKS
tara:strand:+ start:19 stop:180 length:162 start_codon:yes stop_codon:yes gene_type:complete